MYNDSRYDNSCGISQVTIHAQIEAFSAAVTRNPLKNPFVRVSTDTEPNWNDFAMRWCEKRALSISLSLSENPRVHQFIAKMACIDMHDTSIRRFSLSKTSNISPHSSTISFNFRARVSRRLFILGSPRVSRASFRSVCDSRPPSFLSILVLFTSPSVVWFFFSFLSVCLIVYIFYSCLIHFA